MVGMSEKLTINESPEERKIRAGLAAASALGAFTITKPSKIFGKILLALAGVLGATAATGHCPLWKRIGVNTNA